MAAWLRQQAQALGLSRIALAPAEQVPQHRLFAAWLAAAYAGEMDYLCRDAEARSDPRTLLHQARTVLCAALSYAHDPPAAQDGVPRGRIARYARGPDYHWVLRQRLRALAARIVERVGHPVACRVCVDTAPLLERALGARAGLGFQGKNTLLITPGLGSYTVLGELLLDLELPPGDPMEPRCGSCRACLDACPTGALVGPYQLDARRCISYLTIEHRGPIPAALRSHLSTWVFGCDVCQEVCPYNAAGRTGDPELVSGQPDPELRALLRLGTAQFRRFVRRRALRRVRRAQLLRNVAVALGNAGGPADVPALVEALGEREPLIRQHAAWALGRIASRHPEAKGSALQALRAALATEEDPGVRAELAAALGEQEP
ncbi:MAG: tRNA epoxyqueuosine(34) reductase QueG [Myxococcales bacterium]|nr:tRNA epoxyqueuosine(34) reductase QueG [Myxococcota bacterium]MDW8280743.1 tRNA epoxyqueuosine(34) reductase QueG [Myxococcales bacterium]